jgi:hypothetical protein
VIQVERCNRRPAGRRRAEDFTRFEIDVEMVGPTLLPRMEEGCFFLSEFIACGKSVARA